MYDDSVLNDKIKRRNSRIGRFMGRFVLKITGWEVNGEFPKESKMVLIIAPHTSNWDFIYGLFAYFALDIHLNWLGKHSIFVWPLKSWFIRWGGIPVERSERHYVVSQVVQEFDKSDHFILALSPEGTRSFIDKWKTGFYHIAMGARVPIQCVGFDFKKKHIHVGPHVYPQDKESDFEVFQSYFKQEMAKHEDQYNPKIY